MSDIVDEKLADKIVIINLLREIKRLKGLHKMGKLLIDTNGDLYFSEVHTLVSESSVDAKVQESREQIAEYEKAQALSDKLKAVSEAPVTETPAEVPPTPVVEAPQVETPAPVEQPQVVEQPVVQPEQPQPQPIVIQ